MEELITRFVGSVMLTNIRYVIICKYWSMIKIYYIPPYRRKFKVNVIPKQTLKDKLINSVPDFSDFTAFVGAICFLIGVEMFLV
jgi:hypothetical protein